MITIPGDILEIKNEQLRNTATLFWLSTLSDEQRQELNGYLRNFCNAIQPVMGSLAETASELASAITSWVDENPEVKAYLENLK